MTGLKDCNKHLKPKVREFFGKYEKGKDKPAVNPLNKREGEPALIQYEKQTKQKIKKVVLVSVLSFYFILLKAV